MQFGASGVQPKMSTHCTHLPLLQYGRFELEQLALPLQGPQALLTQPCPAAHWEALVQKRELSHIGSLQQPAVLLHAGEPSNQLPFDGACPGVPGIAWFHVPEGQVFVPAHAIA